MAAGITLDHLAYLQLANINGRSLVRQHNHFTILMRRKFVRTAIKVAKALGPSAGASDPQHVPSDDEGWSDNDIEHPEQEV
jgi:hypothetical protein